MNEGETPDILIIGSGAGGGTLARSLRGSGARVLILERGSYLPREPENWSPLAVFEKNRYKPEERWEDRSGRPFRPRCTLLGRWEHQGLRRRVAPVALGGLRSH